MSKTKIIQVPNKDAAKEIATFLEKSYRENYTEGNDPIELSKYIKDYFSLNVIREELNARVMWKFQK